MNWYIYCHKRNDTGEVFYIGVGNTPNYKRAYIKAGRNKNTTSLKILK